MGWVIITLAMASRGLGLVSRHVPLAYHAGREAGVDELVEGGELQAGRGLAVGPPVVHRVVEVHRHALHHLHGRGVLGGGRVRKNEKEAISYQPVPLHSNQPTSQKSLPTMT